MCVRGVPCYVVDLPAERVLFVKAGVRRAAPLHTLCPSGRPPASQPVAAAAASVLRVSYPCARVGGLLTCPMSDTHTGRLFELSMMMWGQATAWLRHTMSEWMMMA